MHSLPLVKGLNMHEVLPKATQVLLCYSVKQGTGRCKLPHLSTLQLIPLRDLKNPHECFEYRLPGKENVFGSLFLLYTI